VSEEEDLVAFSKQDNVSYIKTFFFALPWTHIASLPSEYAFKDASSLSCAFNLMFKAHPAVESLLNQQLRMMFGGQNVKYAAAHLRLGGLKGEAILNRGEGLGLGGPLNQVITAVHTLHKMRKAHGFHAPAALVTDNQRLRWFTMHHFLTDVVSPQEPETVHMDYVNDAAVDVHRLVFVDIAILARAQCLLAYNSGFSSVAM